jgi:hypothetical protein
MSAETENDFSWLRGSLADAPWKRDKPSVAETSRFAVVARHAPFTAWYVNADR